MNSILENNLLFLNSAYLPSLGIPANTIKKWRPRGTGDWIETSSGLYISYQSIPSATKKKAKLTSEEQLKKILGKGDLYTKVYEALNHARLFEYTKYKSIYETDSSLPVEKVTKFAQLHAVLQAIIDLKENEGFRDLVTLYEAFNKLYPGKYTSKNALSNAIRKAMAEGIMNVALDKRAFGNNIEQNSKKFTPLQKFWMANLVGHPAKFTNSKILEKICQACEETKTHKPSLSWVKKWRAELLRNPELFNSRYGQQEANKRMPFASLKHAAYANDLWQMDGWTLPFWGHGYKRFVLVRLIDSNSKKVVGYSFGESEDSALIMEAIRDAIGSTGVLPFEVVTDNHAFNQTQEAKNLIKLFEKKGSRWTVTQNPQYKAIVERYNQHLDNLCKDWYGYLGQGIKSKSIDALAKPELIEQYSKNFLSKEEIRGYAIAVVEKYNKTIQQAAGKSPIQTHDENANPNPIEVNVFDRAELLTAKAEKKISRGQITIMRGAVKWEYQLSSDLYRNYNGTTVVVRYDDLKDGIYLFKKCSGEAIGFVPPKEKINSAKVNQTQEDIEALYRNKGRTVGIKVQGRRELETLSEKAHSIDPEAYARINKITAPKNLLKELEQDSHLRHIAIDKGLQIHLLDGADKVWTTGTTALQPKEKKKAQPFTAKNHTIGLINPQTEFESD